jgi:nucleoside-diphosphate-sugar epimerase
MTTTGVLVLGCGYVGSAVARLARARGQPVFATVRSEARAVALRAERIAVLALSELDRESLFARIDERTHVVVAFPPDDVTDARIAPALARARAISYVSSTGVYGEHRGSVDDNTGLPGAPSARVQRILVAEQSYLALGATVLRCPAIYGPERGLHMRVLRGEHRIPGDGTRHVSRIHAADLAQLLLASGDLDAATRSQTFVVGDLTPAPQIEVVRFICKTYRVPMPEMVPLEAVPESLRADRRVDPTRALGVLRVTLSYPSYREGMAPAATGIAPIGPV